MTPGSFLDTSSGINFTTWSAPLDQNGNGALTFGMVLPPDAATKDATDYIGYLVSSSISLPQQLAVN